MNTETYGLNNTFLKLDGTRLQVGKNIYEINERHRTPQAVTLDNGVTTALHRVLYFMYTGTAPEGFRIDHADGDIFNNDKHNLRIATKAQIAQNTKVRHDNKTGVKGVTFDPPTGKYRAEITANKKTIRLGRFDTLEAAAEARREAEVIYHTHRRQTTPQVKKG